MSRAQISDLAHFLGNWNQSEKLSEIKTSYLTDSFIVFTLKMESVSKNTIFGLEMAMKNGLEKIFPLTS